MNDLRQQREQLENELRKATEEFDKEFDSFTSSYAAKLGPFTISTTISASTLTAIYVFFNALCFAAGIAFTLLGGVIQTLGVSLIVGGLFSFGTFMAQWWDHAWQRNRDTVDRAFNSAYEDKRYAELQRLAEEYRGLRDRLQALPEQSGGE